MSNASTYCLSYNTVDGVGFDGAAKYANVDSPFSAQDYADLAGINVSDIDADDIKAVQDAASHEGPDAWLVVSHAPESQ